MQNHKGWIIAGMVSLLLTITGSLFWTEYTKPTFRHNACTRFLSTSVSFSETGIFSKSGTYVISPKWRSEISKIISDDQIPEDLFERMFIYINTDFHQFSGETSITISLIPRMRRRFNWKLFRIEIFASQDDKVFNTKAIDQYWLYLQQNPKILEEANEKK